MDFRFFDLEGKTVLVTGTTRGIGKAMLPDLLDQGLNLVVVSRGMDRMEKIRDEIGVDASRMRLYDCDFSDTAAVDAVCQEILAKEAHLDGMIHNAAVDPRKTFEDSDDAFWQKVFQVNFFSAVTMTRALLPLVRKSEQGRILFTGSVMDELGGSLLTTYCSTKGALTALTRALAHELKGTSITVNCVVPGAIQVEKEVLGEEGDSLVVAMQSVGRRLTPKDLVGPVCMLLSRLGGGITAQTLVVDGGLLQTLADPDGRRQFEEIQRMKKSQG